MGKIDRMIGSGLDQVRSDEFGHFIGNGRHFFTFAVKNNLNVGAVGYSSVCAGAYEGCSGAKDKGRFNIMCVEGAKEYARRGSCSDIIGALNDWKCEII